MAEFGPDVELASANMIQPLVERMYLLMRERGQHYPFGFAVLVEGEGRLFQLTFDIAKSGMGIARCERDDDFGDWRVVDALQLSFGSESKRESSKAEYFAPNSTSGDGRGPFLFYNGVPMGVVQEMLDELPGSGIGTEGLNIPRFVVFDE